MKRNVVEWAVLIVSLLAIAAVVVLLVVEGVTERRPANPLLELRPEEARSVAQGWLLPATLVNRGDEAVEGVVVEEVQVRPLREG